MNRCYERLLRRRRPAGLVRVAVPLAGVLLVLGGLVPATSSASSGRGADGDRNVELVSAIDRNNAFQMTYAKLSDDGERVLYRIFGGIPGSPSGSADILLATRTAAGWASHSVLPSTEQLLDASYTPYFTTPSLSDYLVTARSGLASHGPESLARLTDGGVQELLHVYPDHLAIGDSGVPTSDLVHLFENVTEPIDGGHVPDTLNVYDFGSTSPVLVSRLPDGSVPTCGVSPRGFANSITASSDASQHWVAADGARVFFESQGSDPSCAGPIELYMRDIATGRTALISGPVDSGPDNGVNTPALVQAGADGSWVIYNTSTNLVVTDTNGTADLYRWTADVGNPGQGTNVCLTCGVPDAGVLANLNAPGAVASQDGSRVYFVSTQQLLPGAGNLYMLDHGTLRAVGSVTTATLGVTPTSSRGTDLTPDGRVLVFASDDSAMNTATTPPSDNSGCGGACLEYYRWDSDSGVVTCVSCSTAGAANVAVSSNLVAGNFRGIDTTHALTADGSRFIFSTAAALMPEDVNGDSDVYEWHDGELGLITDGTTPLTRASILEVSPDGRDVLFASMVAEAPRATPGTLNVYDARIGGGFPAPPTPTPSCVDDQCQGAASAKPQLSVTGSERFSGRGDDESAAFSVTATRRVRGRHFKVAVRLSRRAHLAAVGRARIRGRMRRVAASTRTARDAGTVTLTLTLSRLARRKLAAHGRLDIVLTVTVSGAHDRKVMAMTLRSAHGKAARHAG